MGFFITKKQKKLIRERRQKKKLAGDLKNTANPVQTKVDDDSARPSREEQLPTHVSPSSKKRPRSSSDATISEVALPTTTNTVVLPKGLSSKEAKKARKNIRRQARAQGRDEKALNFITYEENERQKKKKRKVEFPRINDLLRQERMEKEKQATEEALKKVEEQLPAEYKAKYVAMDCEMVGIGSDGKKSVLARVSLTDWQGDTVLDTFVKVPTRVTDFRTWVSGVKPKDIQENAMEVAKCRELVSSLIKDKVVVGHALKNDFNALMISHPKGDIRDTAKYRRFQRYGGNKWRPRKLRDLVKENLGLTIQEEGQSHDSVSDARATMELFKTCRKEWERELETKKKGKTRSS